MLDVVGAEVRLVQFECVVDLFIVDVEGELDTAPQEPQYRRDVRSGQQSTVIRRERSIAPPGAIVAFIVS